MNYENYERAIVERYGIELKNFPGGTVRQPGALPRSVLQALLTALEDPVELKRCRWVSLSDGELEARIENNKERQANGDQVYKPRKKQTGPKTGSGRNYVPRIGGPGSSGGDSSDFDDSD